MILTDEQQHALLAEHCTVECDYCAALVRDTERAVLETLIERAFRAGLHESLYWLRSLRDASNEPPADWLDSSPAMTWEGDK